MQKLWTKGSHVSMRRSLLLDLKLMAETLILLMLAVMSRHRHLCYRLPAILCTAWHVHTRLNKIGICLLWCRVPAAEAVGRISAELLCPYPPGVPLAIPGEVLQHKTIQELQQVVASGGTVTGASDSSLASYLVIAE